MSDAIHVWEYVMHSGVALNAVSVRRSFAGALIRQGSGFACIHPWPEFGDEPIEQQLRLLAGGTPTELAQRALDFAKVDGAARERGVSLFDGLTIPASHYSWSSGQETGPQMKLLLEEGWPALKAKGYPNWGESLKFLEACERVSGGQDLRFRLDFNGCLDEISFARFLEFMPMRVYHSLDFVEDPCPYNEEAWSRLRRDWKVSLALDKGWRDAVSGFDWVVVKPTRRDWRELANRHPNHPLILTSAMDHPMAQMQAAYEAALAFDEIGDRIGLCGLCTQHLFQSDAFLDRVKSPGGRLQPDFCGGGLGFGDILEGLPWRRLN